MDDFAQKNPPTDSARVLERVSALAEQFPFLTVTPLGNSILGKEIPVLKLGGGKRKFLYVAAHHGMEWLTSDLLLRYAKEYCTFYGTGGSVCGIRVRELWESSTVYVVPMLNPDGVDYQIHGVDPENPLRNRLIGMNGGSEDFSHWQANARGVDLNHNYDSGFAEYKKQESETGIACGAPTRFSGQEPESEPEVRALCNLIRFHSPLRLVLSLHTQGEELYWQSRGKSVPGSERAVRMLAARFGYRLAEAEGPAAYGGLTDWCIERCGIPAVTVECGKGINPLPADDASAIYSRLRQGLLTAPVLF